MGCSCNFSLKPINWNLDHLDHKKKKLSSRSQQSGHQTRLHGHHLANLGILPGASNGEMDGAFPKETPETWRSSQCTHIYIYIDRYRERERDMYIYEDIWSSISSYSENPLIWYMIYIYIPEGTDTRTTSLEYHLDITNISDYIPSGFISYMAGWKIPELNEGF